ncbi:MAG TPA: hypothetical protein VD963_07500 [Phycisphaerales bacterium]|nr:hypothetical protein [Phycisphaerales bacterium]
MTVTTPAAEATVPQMERELRKLRAKYLGQVRNPQVRAIGLSKLREYRDPVIFPALLEIFEREGADVRAAVLDIFAEHAADDQGDAALAWTTIFSKDADFRAMARARLGAKLGEGAAIGDRVRRVIAAGIRRGRHHQAVTAAQLAQQFKLYEMIPLLIPAQAGGAGAALGTGGGSGGDLAYIVVGTQRAYISDLTPVVADAAVGFDPEVSVLTEGTVLRIGDAVVTTHVTAIHESLVGLANAGWDGRDTSPLGFNLPAWERWYAQEFKPHREKLAREGGAGAAPTP